MHHGHHFQNTDEPIDKIEEYIECYNTKQSKVKLKVLTPVEYRNQVLQVI